MFFEAGRILAVREMILAKDEAERRTALAKLKPMQRDDFKAIFKAMDGLPVIIRLLDPPLHEFLPTTDEEVGELAKAVGLSETIIRERTEALEEVNPMLGHRGCRLGLTYPEIYEMQAEAIVEAACEVIAQEGCDAQPRIMLPLIGHHLELKRLREIVLNRVHQGLQEGGATIEIPIGTMIELPRACLTANEIAAHADFFSFGTNDLTQTTFGISRDDGGSFIPQYLEQGFLDADPFVSIDPAVAALVDIATKGGRATKPGLSVGICGEHGGEPRSVAVCHGLGLDYVSCSPFRVPIARLAAGHAALSAGE
jgi:pyruvate,orthophosphate dikinase